jgi:hypothetical protein
MYIIRALKNIEQDIIYITEHYKRYYKISHIVTPKFKDKFEYSKPHVRPRNSRAHKSTNYRSIITSVLHNEYYSHEHQSLATSGNKTHI